MLRVFSTGSECLVIFLNFLLAAIITYGSTGLVIHKAKDGDSFIAHSSVRMSTSLDLIHLSRSTYEILKVNHIPKPIYLHKIFHGKSFQAFVPRKA